ncbi:MAG: uroporphyrinogen-III C-methyltransferase, partial [Alphaproteobacteria bacterium]|nr:uroporphyrinogen-III C-methyltransferase [Alphaproteobacteria bacterium]
PRVLALCRADAEVIDVGKRGGRPSPRQPDISRRLIDLAQAGRRVARLKGGDPFLFGRGPEEALALRAAGVPFRVVPGVTAGIGGLAYAGIPATAGETNAAVAFVSGHDPDAFDWEALGRGVPVLVFYMALQYLPVICARLVAAGRLPDEPAAVVCDATTPRQTVLESTLAGLVQDVAARGLVPPALVVVGPVVRLRESLDWWMRT